MATSKETIAFILSRLGDDSRFSARAMFGEYALYADGKVVALICGDTLYVKMLPASACLAASCEQGPPYPGAKPHYIVSDDIISSIDNLPAIFFAIARSIPEKKAKR